MNRDEERSARMRRLGLTPTIQRLAVLEYLDETDRHPTAEEVYAAIRERFPTISRATVYNTLDVLTRSGAIVRLTIDPAASRYDGVVSPHAHFFCRICHKVYDIDLPGVHPFPTEMDGHKIEAVHTYAYGVCAACRRDEEGKVA